MRRRTGITAGIVSLAATAASVGAFATAAHARPRGNVAVDRIAVWNTLDGEVRRAFGDRAGCVVDAPRGPLQLLVTSRRDVKTARKLVKRARAGGTTRIRRIDPQNGEVALQRLAGDLLADVGFKNPDIIVTSAPIRTATTTRCITIDVQLSDQAAPWVRDVIDARQPSWGDRVTLHVVPADQILPPDRRAYARAGR